MDFDITQWNRVSEDAFNNFAYDAGILVKNFDPTSFTPPTDEDILCTTSGNITASMVATMSNLGDDVNGIHGQFKELEILESWAATIGFTALEVNASQLKMALGAADLTTDGHGVKPRMFLRSSDFTNIALIMFKIGGGMTAVVLSNALSTGGVSITTSKSGKANLAVTMTGFQSINAQSEAAMAFYESSTEVHPDVVFSRANVTLAVGEQITVGVNKAPSDAQLGCSAPLAGAFSAIPTTDGTGCIITGLEAGTGDATASITVDGTTYTDTCKVTVVEPEEDDSEG